MKSFFVRVKPQFNGTYPVHSEDCPFLPEDKNRLYLGEYPSYSEALKDARLIFQNAAECNFCARQSLKTSNNQLVSRPKRKWSLNSLDLSCINNLNRLANNN